MNYRSRISKNFVRGNFVKKYPVSKILCVQTDNTNTYISFEDAPEEFTFDKVIQAVKVGELIFIEYIPNNIDCGRRLKCYLKN